MNGINYVRDNENCGIWAPKLVGEEWFIPGFICMSPLNKIFDTGIYYIKKY